MTIFLKLPPNSGHLSITDKFFETQRYLLFRCFTVSKLTSKIHPWKYLKLILIWSCYLQSRHWCPFNLMFFFFKKCLKCLASSSYLLEPKKSIFNRWFWNNNELEHLKYKILIKVFQYILKPIETFLIQNCFLAIPKYVNKTKKNQDKFGSDNRFLNEKTLNYFNKIWSSYSQLISKILLNQQSLTQISDCFSGRNHLTSFCLSKTTKVF